MHRPTVGDGYGKGDGGIGMHGESPDTRLARLEEAMVSVKGDTVYLRKGFDDFKNHYWKELAKNSQKVGGMSAILSLIIASITVVVARAIWP